MLKIKPQRDPRGHSLRVYADVYDSSAFAALSPHDVMAYLALLRELKGYNNGDLSLDDKPTDEDLGPATANARLPH